MDFFGLIPQFGNLAFTIAAFAVVLSIVVAVHEYGHYIVARWSGIHAEVFSLGFGPVVFSRVDRFGTRWQVAALPLGGFVKFMGDADAASGKDGEAISTLSAAEKRRTMHGAPLWARAVTVAAGPAFNFMLSIVVFVAYFMVAGVATEEPVVGEVKPMPMASENLRPGDRIVAMNDIPVTDLASFGKVAEALPPADTIRYTLDRAGQVMTVDGPYPLRPAPTLSNRRRRRTMPECARAMSSSP